MPLKTIVGQINSQDLNDNFSFVNQKAGEAGMEVHGNEFHSVEFETTTGAQEKADVVQTNLTTHKAETVTKVALVTEPYNQTTMTTVNLGFRPKSVTIEACIMSTKYESLGFSNGSLQYCKLYRPSTDAVEITGGVIISFYLDGVNYIQGTVTFTDTGIEITWSIVGTLTGISGNRRFIVSAMTHGEG